VTSITLFDSWLFHEVSRSRPPAG